MANEVTNIVKETAEKTVEAAKGIKPTDIFTIGIFGLAGFGAFKLGTGIYKKIKPKVLEIKENAKAAAEAAKDAVEKKEKEKETKKKDKAA